MDQAAKSPALQRRIFAIRTERNPGRLRAVLLLLVLAALAFSAFFGIRELLRKSAGAAEATKDEAAETVKQAVARKEQEASVAERLPKECDPKVPYNYSTSECPMGWRPLPVPGDGGRMCCSFDLQTLTDRDNKKRGCIAPWPPSCWGFIAVSGGVGMILSLAVERLLAKGIPKLIVKGLRVTALMLNKLARVATKVVAKAAAAAAAAVTRATAQLGMALAKLSAGPIGWILLAIQIFSAVLDVWDPLNYNAFQPNRIYLGMRAMQVAQLEELMRQEGQEPPFIFPVSFVYPKEFDLAMDFLTTAAQAHALETMDEDMAGALLLRMFGTDDEDMTEEERRLAEEGGKRMDSAMEDMDPKVRDEELYKRLCVLVGAENVMVDTSLSTKERIAVTISQKRAQLFNAQNRCLHRDGGFEGFVPLAVHSKHYYTRDGTLTVGLLMNNSDIMNGIGKAASAISDSLGEKIAPIMTVPKLRRNDTPSGKAITQLSILGNLKYGSCMGTVPCSKMLGEEGLCKATVEAEFSYAKYGVTFDDDVLSCRYTCQLCERFGLKLTRFNDPTVSNVTVEYIDCDMYPGQDVMEMLLGQTLTRLLVHKYQKASQALVAIAHVGARAYNAMCREMRPGAGGFCPTTCDKAACTDAKCREAATTARNTGRQVCNVVTDAAKEALCWSEEAAVDRAIDVEWAYCKAAPWKSGCDATRNRRRAETAQERQRCLSGANSNVCNKIIDYVLDDGLYNACKSVCGVTNTISTGVCLGRKGICSAVNQLCKWTGDIPPPDPSCGFLHW